MTRITPRPALAAFIVFVAISGCGNAQSSQSSPHAASGTRNQEVVATVDGQAITAADLDEGIAPDVARLEEQLYQLRKDHLDELISDRLLGAEAKRRGITVEQLVKAEVSDKVEPVSDADVSNFVAANRSRIQGDPAKLEPRIRAYLAEQHRTHARDTFVESLRARARVDVRLPSPPVFRAAVATDGFPFRGPASAPITIVEFSDFHCPYCRAAQPTLTSLLAKYPDKLRLVYRHFPLDGLHPHARRAAEASWCAAQQGRFWQFHDRLYANPPDSSPEALHRFAAEAGLDAAALDTCLASGKAQAAVQQDVDEGTRFGVTGTPGFFVNGRPLSGNQPMETFVSVIEEELKGTR